MRLPREGNVPCPDLQQQQLPCCLSLFLCSRTAASLITTSLFPRHSHVPAVLCCGWKPWSNHSFLLLQSHRWGFWG